MERKFKLNPIACSFELAKEVNGRIQLFRLVGFIRKMDVRGRFM
ncbi:hypothetical protein [Glaesserella parasuis]|nr:hypothetical protein [Glaesserella parasuis]